MKEAMVVMEEDIVENIPIIIIEGGAEEGWDIEVIAQISMATMSLQELPLRKKQ